MSTKQPALTFNGAGDYLSVPDHDSLKLTDYTVELWLKTVGAPTKRSSISSEKTMEKEKATASASATTATQKSYLSTSMTGLQDYSYWWKYAREHDKAGGKTKEAFQRGRIWA